MAVYLGPLAETSGTHCQVLWLTPLRALAADTLRALREPLTVLAPNCEAEARTGDTPAALRARLRKKLPHTLVTTPESLHVSGHWHPVVRIPDGTRTSLRLPCFLYRNHTLVLPAFGSFTGGAILTPERGDRIFVAMWEEVIELPPALIA